MLWDPAVSHPTFLIPAGRAELDRDRERAGRWVWDDQDRKTGEQILWAPKRRVQTEVTMDSHRNRG